MVNGELKSAPRFRSLTPSFTIHHSSFTILARRFIIALAVTMAVSPAHAGDVSKGRVVFTLAAGCNCHTPEHGPVGAGGTEVATPFGKFYGPNITPDVDTGIGARTAEDIAPAIPY